MVEAETSHANEKTESTYFYTLSTAKSFSFLFFLLLFNVVLRSPGMFFKKHGRRHGVAGLVYLIWLIIGFVESCPAPVGTAEWENQ